MDTIVVNDTNIFIDLWNIDLLNEFFKLPFKIHTTDFVIDELMVEEQRKQVLEFETLNKLNVKRQTAEEILEIVQFQAERDNNVSITDCSVWLYARKNNYRLITGDSKLRKSAIASGITVCGILYIFDQLIEHHIITPLQGYNKLQELSTLNNRLPSKEIDKRLKLWEAEAE
ncbi:MAG: PIN domain-containing protein [Bacteroidaceae bacterium]|nr:PIN domain-containing protein [Bacteroidaceae bacterium]